VDDDTPTDILPQTVAHHRSDCGSTARTVALAVTGQEAEEGPELAVHFDDDAVRWQLFLLAPSVDEGLAGDGAVLRSVT
jgi:hypothetical protein